MEAAPKQEVEAAVDDQEEDVVKKHESKTLSHWTVDEFALILDVGVDVARIDVACRLHLKRSTAIRHACRMEKVFYRISWLHLNFAFGGIWRKRGMWLI